jgi:hypothetical protein
MTKIILGGRKKYESVIDYLDSANIDYLIFDMTETKDLVSDKISNIVYFDQNRFFSAGSYLTYFEDNAITPTQIVNFRDQKNWIDLEDNLNRWLFKKSLSKVSKDFITYKSTQHEICNELEIPVLPTHGDKIIVKKDAGYSGGTGFYITENIVKNQKNVFTQKYVDIDYTVAVHAYVDDNNSWHPYCYHKVNYDNNCPTDSISPFFDYESQINDYLKKLMTKIQLDNKLIFWQFVKPKNDNQIYNMDFNCRPAGGFEAGSYDRDIAGHNVLDYFLQQIQCPDQIQFTKQVECIYKVAQQFGYSDLERKVTEIQPVQFEVKPT